MQSAAGVSRAATAGPDRGALLTIRQACYNQELSRAELNAEDSERNRLLAGEFLSDAGREQRSCDDISILRD